MNVTFEDHAITLLNARNQQKSKLQNDKIEEMDIESDENAKKSKDELSFEEKEKAHKLKREMQIKEVEQRRNNFMEAIKMDKVDEFIETMMTEQKKKNLEMRTMPIFSNKKKKNEKQKLLSSVHKNVIKEIKNKKRKLESPKNVQNEYKEPLEKKFKSQRTDKECGYAAIPPPDNLYKNVKTKKKDYDGNQSKKVQPNHQFITNTKPQEPTQVYSQQAYQHGMNQNMPQFNPYMHQYNMYMNAAYQQNMAYQNYAYHQSMQQQYPYPMQPQQMPSAHHPNPLLNPNVMKENDVKEKDQKTMANMSDHNFLVGDSDDEQDNNNANHNKSVASSTSPKSKKKKKKQKEQMTDEEKQEIQQKVKMTVAKTVSDIVAHNVKEWNDKNGAEVDYNLTASKEFIFGLTELVYDTAVVLGNDLDAFRKHHGKKTVMVEDFMLFCRRNQSIKQKMIDHHHSLKKY